jgi:hypothetical protein
MRLGFNLLFVFVFLGLSSALAQTATTAQSGNWDDPSTWVSGLIPNSSFGTITINHTVTVTQAAYPFAAPLIANQIIINDPIGADVGNLIVNANSALQVDNGSGYEIRIIGSGTFSVSGRLIINTLSLFDGFTLANANFLAGSEVHTQTVLLPTATWDLNSSVTVTGVTATAQANSAWSNVIGDVIVNCATLGSSSINFGGFLNTIQSLSIQETSGNSGGSVVLMSTAGVSNVTINDGITVTGNSRLFLATAGSLTVNLTGDFSFNSTSPNYSQSVGGDNTTATINFLNGDFIMGSGEWRFSGSGANNSGIFNVQSGDIVVTGGILNEQGTGTAQGILQFTGAVGNQNLTIATGSLVNGSTMINLTLNKASGNLILNHSNSFSNLNLTSGTLVLNGNAITVNGALVNGGAVVDPSLGSFILGGSGTVTNPLLFSDNGIFNQLVLNRAVTLTVQNQTASSNVTVSSLSLLNGTLQKPAGSLSIADNGIITRGTGTLSLGSTLVPVGVYDITYNNTSGTTAQELISSSTAIRNFSKSGASTLSLDKSLICNGTFAVNGGTFSSGGFAVTLNGPSSLSSTATFAGLTVNSSFTQNSNTITTITGNVAVGASGSIAFSSGTTVFNGDVAITNSGSIAFNSVTIGTGFSLTAPAGAAITLNGNFGGTGTFNHNGGTVIFNGNTVLSGSIKSFTNITVNNAATLSGIIGFNVEGNLINNGTISFTNGSATWVANGSISGSGSTTFRNFVINSGFTVSSSKDIHITRNFVGTGNYTSSAATIFPSASSISGIGNKTFTSMTVSGVLAINVPATFSGTGTLSVSGTLNAASPITFSGQTTITGSGATFNNNVLISAAGTLVTSSGNITINGNFTNEGIFTHNNGTVTFGTVGTTKTIGGSSALPTRFNNLIVSNNSSLTDVTVANTRPVELSRVLTVNASAIFDADGPAGNSSFTLVSSSDSPVVDGSVGPLLNGAQVQGNFTVQRFISSEGRIYRLVASPVVNATVNQLIASGLPITGVFTDPSTCEDCDSDDASMFSYEETREPPYVTTATTRRAYEAFPVAGQSSTTTFLTNGDGYNLFFRHNLTGPVTLAFRGSHPAAGANISLPVAPTTTAGDAGYSLVGNPYPSAIRWDNTGWVRNLISDQIAVRDNANLVFNYYSAAAGDGVIATGQAFWVQSIGNGASLQINENAKTTNSTSFFRTRSPLSDVLEISLTKNETQVTDKTRIIVQPHGSSLYDPLYDAIKLNNGISLGDFTEEVHDLSVLSSDATPSTLAVNVVNQSNYDNTIDIHVADLIKVDEATVTYTFGLSVSGVFEGVEWILYDRYLNKAHNLSKASYSFAVFSSSKESSASDRFYLMKSGSDKHEANLRISLESQLNVYPNPVNQDELNIIYNGDVVAEGALVNTNGAVISQFSVSPTANKIKIDMMNKNIINGVYFMKISSGKEVAYIKLVIAR